MSSNQKWQYGKVSFTYSGLDDLSNEELAEWNNIDTVMKNKMYNKEWFNVTPFLVNLVTFIGAIIIMILT